MSKESVANRQILKSMPMEYKYKINLWMLVSLIALNVFDTVLLSIFKGFDTVGQKMGFNLFFLIVRSVQVGLGLICLLVCCILSVYNVRPKVVEISIGIILSVILVLCLIFIFGFSWINFVDWNNYLTNKFVNRLYWIISIFIVFIPIIVLQSKYIKNYKSNREKDTQN